MRPLSERKKLVARLPWVQVQVHPSPCDGIKWSKMSMEQMRAYRRFGRTALPERARCKRRGWYRFTALKPRGKYPPRPATSGVYCYDHVSIQLNDYEKEHARLLSWLEQNDPSWL